MGELKKKVLIIVMGLLISILSVFGLPFNLKIARASGTIYIRVDGSVDPSTAHISSVDNTLYSFTGNIYEAIVVERDNIVIDGTGYKVQGNESGSGIDLNGRSNVTIKNVEVTHFRYGIMLMFSSNNILVNNTARSNNWAGVQFGNSSFNTISGNNVTNNGQDGVALYWSSFNTVSGNNIANHSRDGIAFYSDSNNNTLSGNNITNCDWDGVRLDFGSFNTVSGNNITNCDGGIFAWSSNHTIYHNNFINNTRHAGSFGSNTWDDGYPAGGNYWSNYGGVDLLGGPYQNETGSDGIGDTPFVIDEDNQDSYPLMSPYMDFSPTPTPTPAATPSPTPVISPSTSPSPTSTPSPTPSTTPTPSPSPSPTPTATPVPTPSPTPTPAVTPTPTPALSPSPTIAPTTSPTTTPFPSPSPTLTTSPSPTPTPSPDTQGFSLPMEVVYVAGGVVAIVAVAGTAILVKKRQKIK